MAEHVSESPLRDVVLCGTSLDQDARTRLQSLVSEMGATHKLDLTSDVTHLLVGSINSEKYKHVARHRPDITVLRPEWLEAVQDVWKSGDELDLDKLDADFHLPTFFELNICLSGFTDTRQRQKIQAGIEANGAAYHGDLTKAVTHLIVAQPTGAKYDRAQVWNIKTVSLAWYERSLERGMVLDETAFNPRLPLESQGANTFVPRGRKTRSVKRAAPSEQNSIDPNQRRKIRRTASTRLSSQSQTLWDDLKPISAVDSPTVDDSWTQSVDPQSAGGALAEDHPADDVHPVKVEPVEQERRQGLFSRWKCFTYGHDVERNAKLRVVLSENGAEIVDTADDLADQDALFTALILPSEWIARKDPPQRLPRYPPSTALVTELWVERCLVQKRMLSPDSDILGQAHLDLPAACFQGYVISSSGLGNDVRYVNKIIKAAGGQYQEVLDRKTTLLLHDPAKPDLEKPVYCAERSIDVVTPQWLYESVRRGKPLAARDYALPQSVRSAVHKVIAARRQAAAGKGDEAPDQASSGTLDYASEEHKRLVRKHTGQRLTGTRRANTPSLPLANGLPVAVQANTQPLPRPQPLTSLQPNSQERPRSLPSTNSEKRSSSTPSPRKGRAEEKENDVLPADGDHCGVGSASLPAYTSRPASEHATEMLNSLLARRQNSSSNHSQDRPDTAKRKRTLGRAASGSTTNSFTRPATNLFVEDDEEASEIQQAPLPSQQITYDAPGVLEQRKYMARKMGTTFEDYLGRRVHHVGMVKDADAGGRANVAGRLTRGRQRDAVGPDPFD